MIIADKKHFEELKRLENAGEKKIRYTTQPPVAKQIRKKSAQRVDIGEKVEDAKI